MSQISVVIGANWGDEGKGLVTDFLSTPDTLVVRFNGGAQAGHTVVTPDGQRHVFHHFGSGTLRGAKTQLSRFFIVNPYQFVKERAALGALAENPIVYIDPLASVTTPYDMLLNRAIEQKRSTHRHGSCGLGINETVTRRVEAPEYDLPFYLLYNEAALNRQLWRIAMEWMPRRAEALGIPVPDVPSWQKEAYLEACKTLVLETQIRSDVSELSIQLMKDLPVVFEGAQGLRLDEVYGKFPHVTRSRTGLINVAALMREVRHRVPRPISAMQVYYVTRSYLTRHGAGPLPGEVDGHPFGWTGPETNVEGEWQGRFRYAPLDFKSLREIVWRDYFSTSHVMDPHGALAVTCLDQGGDLDLEQLALEVGLPVLLTSHGPTRADVQQHAAVLPQDS